MNKSYQKTKLSVVTPAFAIMLFVFSYAIYEKLLFSVIFSSKESCAIIETTQSQMLKIDEKASINPHIQVKSWFLCF